MPYKIGLTIKNGWLNMADQTSRKNTETGIGKRLAQIRKVKGFSQRELADRLGLSQPNISDIERGRLRLNAWQIVEIAKALNVSSDMILGLEDIEKPPLIGRRFLKRFRQIDHLSKRDQQAVISLLDAFLSQKSL